MNAAVHPGRLFLGSCLSLVSTSVCFAAVGAIMGALKAQFLLSNEQAGWIGGAAIWGFTVSIIVLGPLCNVLGMGNLLRFAMLCHFAGPLLMIFANGFWMLFFGALVTALGNGTVEAVCNPLIATLYPDQKTKKLNQFHVWFPGGIVLGGVGCYLLSQLEAAQLGALKVWQLQIGLVLVPTVLYAICFIGQKFPATERVQSGVSFSGMVGGALGRPLFYVLIACMAVTASLELGPGRWIPAVLEAGGIAGILVLAYINGLMAILRFFAGPVVHRLSPTGILVCSAILSGVGLYWFSFAETIEMAFASATVFALGVCYFWPTMLGVTSERVPRSGELGLALIGGTGMLVTGLVTSPQMGHIADNYLHEKLVTESREATLKVLGEVELVYGAARETMIDPVRRKEVSGALDKTSKVLADASRTGTLPKGDTIDALRTAARDVPPGDAAAAVQKEINKIILPADNYGGRMSFRYIAPFAGFIIVVFGAMFAIDRARGGYKAEKLGSAD